MLNEKLCKGEMLNEYLELLRTKGKLRETISEFKEDLDTSDMDDEQLKETAKACFEEEKDRLSCLYFDYLNSDKKHLI